MRRYKGDEKWVVEEKYGLYYEVLFFYRKIKVNEGLDKKKKLIIVRELIRNLFLKD